MLMRSEIIPLLRRFRALCACALVAGAAGDVVASALRAGDLFPDPKAFGLEGKVPALKGKVVLVDFWASWCAPCRHSFPALANLQKKYGPQGFVVLGISVDDDAAAMARFLKSHPAGFAVARDAGKKLVSAVAVETMPTSFLIDRAGKVHSVHRGYRGAETDKLLSRAIEGLLQTASTR